MNIGAFDITEPIPELKEPHVVSVLVPWMDAGSVGTLAIGSLMRYFDAQELGKLSTPGRFFDFTRYRPTAQNIEGRREITVPNSHIYLVKRESGNDLLLFHLLEPHSNAEEYLESVIQLLTYFKVERYLRIGGMYSSVPHTRPLRVTGSPGTENIEELSGLISVRRSSGNYQGPLSILSLANDALEESGVETMSLMIQLPQYLDLDEDYAGEARLLEIICQLYQLPASLIDREPGTKQYSDLTKEMSGNSAFEELVGELEAAYDARNQSSSSSLTTPPLSPKVDQFLREMGQQFEGR